MNKRIIFSTVILVSTIAFGGAWVYQADRFEKSIEGSVSEAQTFLQTFGVTLTYDEIKTSKYLFKVHLVNPKISGTVPAELGEDFKKIVGTKVLYASKGEMIGVFSVLTNTLTIRLDGDSQVELEGPINARFLLAKPKNYTINVQRKDYDIFGNESFLSLKNIKMISSEMEGLSLQADGQKLFEMKGAFVEALLDFKGRALDVSFNNTIDKIQFFNGENLFKGTMEGIEDLNLQVNSRLALLAAVGPQDQKMVLKLHLNDADNYIKDLKDIKEKINATQSQENSFNLINTIFPEGTRLDISDMYSKDDVNLMNVKGNFERLKDRFSITMAMDYQVTDQWEKYCQLYSKQMVKSQQDMLSPEYKFILDNSEIVAKIIPQLQAFGKMNLDLRLDIPLPLMFDSGKVSLNLKSDLYNVGVEGSLKQKVGLFKIKTHKAADMLGDMEKYATRVSTTLDLSLPKEIKQDSAITALSVAESLAGIEAIRSSIVSGVAVLRELLEPKGSEEQSLEMEVAPNGNIKIGKYDIQQLMTLYAINMEKNAVKAAEDAAPLMAPKS